MMNKCEKTKKRHKTVLITGATSGIGIEISRKFAEAGWDIICHYFSSDSKAGELKDIIEKHDASCRLFKVDFSSQGQLNRWLKKLDRFAIDSIVNNAGTYLLTKHFGELTAVDISNVFMINTFAPMMLASRVFGKMKLRNFGRIVNISSIAAKYGGSSYSMPYGCSKRALEGLTKTLAKEGAPYNVLVNTVRPGVIDTDFHKRFPKDMKKRISMIPLRMMGSPDSVAEMAYYLGSDKNTFITNEVISVAGGE